MFTKLRPRLIYANVIATLALFLALSTGGAYATHLVVDSSDVDDESLTGADILGKARTSTTAAVNGSLTTDDIAGQQAHAATGTPFVDGTLTQWDIKNGSLTGGDLANNTVSGGKITDNSLKGADVDEASLGAVPSALLGGFGRWRGGGYCDPDSTTYVTCGVVTLNLPSQSRVLVNAVLMAEPDAIAYSDVLGSGVCRVATSLGSLPNSSVAVIVEQGRLINEREAVAVTAITYPLGGSTVDFGVECNESSWTDPRYGIQFQSVNVSAVALSPN